MPYPYFQYPFIGGFQNPQNVQQGTQSIQSGFITVPTEDEALRYPVAPGNSMTFKVENQPIVIEKTMGTSQLDSPRIERFRLVKEDAPVTQEKPAVAYALAEDVERLAEEIDRIKTALSKRPAKKKEDNEDE